MNKSEWIWPFSVEAELLFDEGFEFDRFRPSASCFHLVPKPKDWRYPLSALYVGFTIKVCGLENEIVE